MDLARSRMPARRSNGLSGAVASLAQARVVPLALPRIRLSARHLRRSAKVLPIGNRRSKVIKLPELVLPLALFPPRPRRLLLTTKVTPVAAHVSETSNPRTMGRRRAPSRQRAAKSTARRSLRNTTRVTGSMGEKRPNSKPIPRMMKRSRPPFKRKLTLGLASQMALRRPKTKLPVLQRSRHRLMCGVLVFPNCSRRMSSSIRHQPLEL